MDHWGDPWADNASHRSPTKDAVASPLPPAFTFAPVPLNGFVDDAGWGNNDEDGFGDWATSPRVDSGNVAGNVALKGVESLPAGDQALDSARWGSTSHQGKEDLDQDWPEAVSNTAQDFEHVDSEPSDSATVSQLDEVADKDTVKEPILRSQPDVESLRSSTSPSETSRNEYPIESPRTSIEDERSITKGKVPQDEASASTSEPDTVVTETSSEVESKVKESDKAPEDSEDADKHAPGTSSDPKGLSPSSPDDLHELDVHEESDVIPDDATAVQSRVPSTAFASDEAALAQLFPSSRDSGEQVDAHDDPIYTTSARKAWYRLTRKQTMREFNHGDNDDNYIRVTWMNSHVRTEVNKVVGRWAREDRISGTGPGARASFYWDTAAPPEPKAPFGHLRTQSSVPTTKTALPARQSLPPLATTDKPAAFDWSSPASADPWRLDSPAQHSISTPLALKNPAVAMIQQQEGRAVSVDFTPRRPEQTMHKRTATVSHTSPETTAVTKLISTPVSQLSADVSDPWTNGSSIDSSSTSTAKAVDLPIDDEDDWGEMVQTPTLPAPNQLDPFPQPASSNTEITQPSSSRPGLLGVRPAQAEPTESMFASPIVRLQSTISPTSALFQTKSFVPLRVEQGPVGPELLKPANRNIQSTPEKKPKEDEFALSSPEKFGAVAPTLIEDKGASDGEDHAWTAPEHALSHRSKELHAATPTNRESTSIAQPVTPIQASADPWANADFSFFESSLSVPALQPTSQMQEISGLSDPSFTVSRSTPDLTSLSRLPQAFSRSPPRDIMRPVPQPLTTATSSVQRRRVEEEQTISNILAGLPNLRYMLR
ncbi:uncharacterized protein EKO05_0009974 [Ascochyta rabiei]|uniref:Uncharacterized protein n=1 Tax=Didymella rabiei TaxID=5454 RepID=A0A162YD34_DIDRA|nr:uncharacterized protein EKO05_0009974 [Ascochyta rabiei]KZM19967.1 hypothetical protein ST47_g8893 [Ascochyta rabiei]UPX19721.1 hypothetical protein EKO05_0009974 [Ascochyta rabiei]